MKPELHQLRENYDSLCADAERARVLVESQMKLLTSMMAKKEGRSKSAVDGEIDHQANVGGVHCAQKCNSAQIALFSAVTTAEKGPSDLSGHAAMVTHHSGCCCLKPVSNHHPASEESQPARGEGDSRSKSTIGEEKSHELAKDSSLSDIPALINDQPQATSAKKRSKKMVKKRAGGSAQLSQLNTIEEPVETRLQTAIVDEYVDALSTPSSDEQFVDALSMRRTSATRFENAHNYLGEQIETTPFVDASDSLPMEHRQEEPVETGFVDCSSTPAERKVVSALAALRHSSTPAFKSFLPTNHTSTTEFVLTSENQTPTLESILTPNHQTSTSEFCLTTSPWTSFPKPKFTSSQVKVEKKSLTSFRDVNESPSLGNAISKALSAIKRESAVLDYTQHKHNNRKYTEEDAYETASESTSEMEPPRRKKGVNRMKSRDSRAVPYSIANRKLSAAKLDSAGNASSSITVNEGFSFKKPQSYETQQCHSTEDHSFETVTKRVPYTGKGKQPMNGSRLRVKSSAGKPPGLTCLPCPKLSGMSDKSTQFPQIIHMKSVGVQPAPMHAYIPEQLIAGSSSGQQLKAVQSDSRIRKRGSLTALEFESAKRAKVDVWQVGGIPTIEVNHGEMTSSRNSSSEGSLNIDIRIRLVRK